MNVGIETLAVGLALIVSGHLWPGVALCALVVVVTFLADALAEYEKAQKAGAAKP